MMRYLCVLLSFVATCAWAGDDSGRENAAATAKMASVPTASPPAVEEAVAVVHATEGSEIAKQIRAEMEELAAEHPGDLFFIKKEECEEGSCACFMPAPVFFEVRPDAKKEEYLTSKSRLMHRMHDLNYEKCVDRFDKAPFYFLRVASADVLITPDNMCALAFPAHYSLGSRRHYLSKKKCAALEKATESAVDAWNEYFDSLVSSLECCHRVPSMPTQIAPRKARAGQMHGAKVSDVFQFVKAVYKPKNT